MVTYFETVFGLVCRFSSKSLWDLGSETKSGLTIRDRKRLRLFDIFSLARSTFLGNGFASPRPDEHLDASRYLSMWTKLAVVST